MDLNRRSQFNRVAHIEMDVFTGGVFYELGLANCG
jgi:hypothetical protein